MEFTVIFIHPLNVKMIYIGVILKRREIEMVKSTTTSTAAFLAGVTTLAVSLPLMAAERNFDAAGFEGSTAASEVSAEFLLPQSQDRKNSRLAKKTV